MSQQVSDFFLSDVWDLKRCPIGAGPYFEKAIVERTLDFRGIHAPVMKQQVKDYIQYIMTEGYTAYKHYHSIVSEQFRRWFTGIQFLASTTIEYTDIQHDFDALNAAFVEYVKATHCASISVGRTGRLYVNSNLLSVVRTYIATRSYNKQSLWENDIWYRGDLPLPPEQVNLSSGPISINLTYKAVDLIHSRSNEKREQVGLPLRTDAGGLLTGFIYCAACGQRLCINHCRTGKRGPENRVYQWDVYRCYRKVNSKNSCSGQTTYRANQVEKAVVEVVREFFSRVKRLPEGKQLEAAMGREKAVHQKALKDAQAVVEKTSKAVTALEEEVVKALTGESKLDLAIVNQLMNKKKAELDAATQEYDRILQIIADEGQRLQEKAEKLRELQHWADIFDKATRETQHMIIAGLVERVDVGKGYDIRIKLRISATQFFNPDKEPEGIEQAS